MSPCADNCVRLNRQFSYHVPNVVHLAGCFSNGLLAFVLPPLFYLSLYWQEIKEHSYSSVIIGANSLLIVAGTAFSLVTTALLIKDKIG